MARPKVETSVSIDAPLDLIWRVMLDTPSYPLWNPFIVRVEGLSANPRVGEFMKLHVRWHNGSGVVSPEQITVRNDPSTSPDGLLTARLEYAFRGPLHTLNLVRGNRTQSLSQRTGEPTLYHTEEAFSGLLTFGVPLANVRDGFERHAQALKLRAESLAKNAL